jgi:hypothetical protein
VSKLLFVASILATALCVTGALLSQPRPDRPPPPPPGGPGGLERILDNLNLPEKKRAQAQEALDAHHRMRRRTHDAAHSELLARMKEVLNDEQFRRFKDAADRMPPGPPGPPQGPPPRGVPTDDLVRRIMAFDRNGDGKVTKDELPERLHHLIELGDANGDGALDRDELTQLAEKMRRAGPSAGGPGGGREALRQVVDDLKLDAEHREKARQVLRDHDERMRKVNDDIRADLLGRMRDVLDAEQYRRFREELDRRPPGPPGPRGGPPR